jgi:hypothetical protein
VRSLRALAMVNFADPVLPTEDEVLEVLARLSPHGPLRAQDLVSSLEPSRRALGLGGLAWLVKLGLLTPVDVSAVKHIHG